MSNGALAGGILCIGSSPTILNCLIVGNRANSVTGGAAFYGQDSGAVLSNCTIADNVGGTAGAGVYLSDSTAVLSNSIIWANTPSQIQITGVDNSAFDYSVVEGGFPGTENLNTNPCFVLPGYWADPADITAVLLVPHSQAIWVGGDYHLMSSTGRWDPVTMTWAKDIMSSPCIDTGDPTMPIEQERMPNGGRINMGVYGGTNQASMSASDSDHVCLSSGDRTGSERAD
jgi:hypothetical protein